MPTKLTALLVDDDNEWLQIFEELLAPKFIVVKANSISEVQKFLDAANRKIDIALVDIFSLEEDNLKEAGLDIMSLLNKEGVPCVATTAFGNDRVQEILTIGKAKDIWFKTEKIMVLKEKIESVLTRE